MNFMNVNKYLRLFCAAALLGAFSLDAAPKKGSKNSTNYRQSLSKKSDTVTNPYAITAKKRAKEDPAATAALKKFIANRDKMVLSGKFNAIPGMADKLIAAQKKLTPDQKSLVIFYKADAFLRAKNYNNASKFAQQGMKLSSYHIGKHSSIAIRIAMAKKQIAQADKAISAFEKADRIPDAQFYGAAAEVRFAQKRFDDAFEYLKSYGRQPDLSCDQRIEIFSGFGKYYIHKKRYKDAIAQFNAIKTMYGVDQYNAELADLQIAHCYATVKNKAKAAEIYKALTKSKNGKIRSLANNELKKLNKTKQQAKKKKPAAQKGSRKQR